MQNNSLPFGFKSVADAIKIINKDTRENPTVDTNRMASAMFYIKKNGNFNIFLLRKDPKTKRVKDNGVVPVYIQTDLEAELLKDAIRNKFKDTAGYEYDDNEVSARSVTTVIEEGKGSYGRPKRTKRGIAKVGESIGASTVDKSTAGESA